MVCARKRSCVRRHCRTIPNPLLGLDHSNIGKRTIEYGQYHSKGTVNCVNYATNINIIAKEVMIDYTEEKYVLTLSEHFERSIRPAFS